MFIALAVAGVMLFFVCRSMFKVWKLGSAEMTARDRGVALAIVAAMLVAFVAVVLILQYERG
jgi:hypothetical protein